jgi:hypothetical protein
VQFITLLALSDEGAPAYDAELAAKLAALGVPSFACTPMPSRSSWPPPSAATMWRPGRRAGLQDKQSSGWPLRPVARPAAGPLLHGQDMPVPHDGAQAARPPTIHWRNAMAGAGLLMLLDDIAAILDDVALMTKVAARKSVAMADDVSVMTKVAAQKTAGVLGDDLALNAQQVTGVRAEREFPWSGPWPRARWSTRSSWCRRRCSSAPSFPGLSRRCSWSAAPFCALRVARSWP